MQCFMGSFHGPRLGIKVVAGLAVPYVYVGPLRGSRSTAVELYLQEAVAQNTVGVEDIVVP